MKLKNKIKFTVVFSMLILSIMTISYARYILNILVILFPSKFSAIAYM